MWKAAVTGFYLQSLQCLDTNISKNVLNFFLEILIKFLNFF